MKNSLVAIVFLCIASITIAAPLDRISADVLDPNAPDGIVKTFDATKLNMRQLRNRAGRLTRNQTIAIWCEGDRMGAGDTSAFDVFVGDENGKIYSDLRKLGVTLDMKLVDVCWRNQEQFERRRR